MRIDEALRANSTETVALAEGFVRAHPDNVDGWIFLSRAHQVRGNFGPMMDAAKSALAADPKHALARALMVDALYRNGEMDNAYALARQIEAERKFDPNILLELATFYGQANNFAQAARLLERVRVLQPTNAKALQSLAAAYAALGDLEKTEAMVDQLL